MRKLLKNDELNNEFYSKGYVKFPLLSKTEINEIKTFYNSIKTKHNTTESYLHTTLNTSNEEIIAKVNTFLRPYFTKNLNQYLINCDYTIAGFLVKDKGKNTKVNLHQDWTYVDEKNYTAFNLWVSLIDTSKNNGCMQFVPYSQSIANTLRVSPDIPSFFKNYEDKIIPFLVDVPTKAGECVMFHQSILHASHPNKSNTERIACISCGYPNETTLLHHYMPNANDYSNIEQYEININSLINLKKDSRPSNAKLIQNISYDPPKITFKEFEKYMLTKLSLYDKLRVYLKKIVN